MKANMLEPIILKQNKPPQLISFLLSVKIYRTLGFDSPLSEGVVFSSLFTATTHWRAFPERKLESVGDQLNCCPCNNVLVKLFSIRGKEAQGEEQLPWENRTGDGAVNVMSRSQGFRNDILLLYFTLSVFCGSFCIHYLNFNGSRSSAFLSLYLFIFSILLITDSFFFFYFSLCCWKFKFWITENFIQTVHFFLFFFKVLHRQNKTHLIQWHESSVIVIYRSIPFMWWVAEDKAGSEPHLLSSLLPYLDQKQQLDKQVLWLILPFSADYRGALG